MTLPGRARIRARGTAAAPRVGLFGLLGQGNLGNDGSLEAVLAYLRAEHPEAVVDSLCSGPEQVTARYGIPAARLNWCPPRRRRASGKVARARKALDLGLGLGIDACRTATWVRRHDVVIVPGMGVLEVTVPMRPWQTPYSVFLLCASGRLFGTKVALVSVGANVIRQRLTRWLITAAARLAHYRSFRDTISRDALRHMGLRSADDAVYPDLVFSLPAPRDDRSASGAVGIGVMDYSGGNDDRLRARALQARYLDSLTRFVVWLLESGRQVRLFTSDAADDGIVAEILARARAHRPDQDGHPIVAEPAASLDDLMRQLARVDTVVATRYHNVLFALKLAKPTLALGYAAKHAVLMADMGLSEFCLSVESLEVARLIEQFIELERQSEHLRRAITERGAVKARLVGHQFAEMSAVLFPESAAARDGRDNTGAPRSGTAPGARAPLIGVSTHRNSYEPLG